VSRNTKTCCRPGPPSARQARSGWQCNHNPRSTAGSRAAVLPCRGEWLIRGTAFSKAAVLLAATTRPSQRFRLAAPLFRSGRSWVQRQMAGSGGGRSFTDSTASSGVAPRAAVDDTCTLIQSPLDSGERGDLGRLISARGHCGIRPVETRSSVASW
jgi:hypothetical protein